MLSLPSPYPAVNVFACNITTGFAIFLIYIRYDVNPVNLDSRRAFELVKNLGESKPYLKRDRSKTYYGPTNPAPQQGNWPKPKSANSTQIEQLKNQARDLTRQGRTMEATKLFNRAWEAEHEIKR